MSAEDSLFLIASLWADDKSLQRVTVPGEYVEFGCTYRALAGVIDIYI